jgi:hypothetical protein
MQRGPVPLSHGGQGPLEMPPVSMEAWRHWNDILLAGKHVDDRLALAEQEMGMQHYVGNRNARIDPISSDGKRGKIEYEHPGKFEEYFNGEAIRVPGKLLLVCLFHAIGAFEPLDWLEDHGWNLHRFFQGAWLVSSFLSQIRPTPQYSIGVPYRFSEHPGQDAYGQRFDTSFRGPAAMALASVNKSFRFHFGTNLCWYCKEWKTWNWFDPSCAIFIHCCGLCHPDRGWELPEHDYRCFLGGSGALCYGHPICGFCYNRNKFDRTTFEDMRSAPPIAVGPSLQSEHPEIYAALADRSRD